MPEYLLPFEENTIFTARTRQIQKRPFSLAVSAVIIPDVRNKALKDIRNLVVNRRISQFLLFCKTREANGKYEPA